jgi:hypothetical protein
MAIVVVAAVPEAAAVATARIGFSRQQEHEQQRQQQ